MSSGNPGARFLARFVVLAVVFYAATLSPAYTDHVFPWVVDSQAWFSNLVLVLIGYGTSVDGPEVRSSVFALRISEGCDAVEAMALYSAACLAFPASPRGKAAGIASGLLAIYVLNVLRIVTLFLTGVHAYGWFHTVHVDLWPTIIVVEAVLFWGWWSRSAERSTPSTALA